MGPAPVIWLTNSNGTSTSGLLPYIDTMRSLTLLSCAMSPQASLETNANIHQAMDALYVVTFRLLEVLLADCVYSDHPAGIL